jgi:2-polyprenyl-3-methyl-5-hydroxy-6-metoxy-1,4-benzoquinol methylase
MVFDIKNSKQLHDREYIQYKLIDAIKEVNEEHSNIIVSNFIITLGDEWQGLLKYPCHYQKVIDFFEKKLNNLDIYCGIGIGNISIHNFELTVNQLDGPAFYLAREAITYAKQKNLSLVILKDWV